MYKHSEIKQRICKLLLITPEQYATHQYNNGLNYLQLYLHGMQPASRELEGNKIFWAWWRNQWAMRDHQYLLQNHKGNHMPIWLNSHDPAMLAAERYPVARLLGNSYAVMIGRVIKEEVAA